MTTTTTPTTEEARAQLIDLASGGDGIVANTIQELDPPQVIGGHTYRWRVVQPAPTKRDPHDRNYLYVDTREQAEKLVNIGQLGV